MSPAAGRGTSSISAAGWAPASATWRSGCPFAAPASRSARCRRGWPGSGSRRPASRTGWSAWKGDYGDLPAAVATRGRRLRHRVVHARAGAGSLLRGGGAPAAPRRVARRLRRLRPPVSPRRPRNAPSPASAAAGGSMRCSTGRRCGHWREAAGFRHLSTTDLTPHLELGRPRDHAGRPVRPSVRLAAARGSLRPPDRWRRAAAVPAPGVDRVRSRVVPARSGPAEGAADG